MHVRDVLDQLDANKAAFEQLTRELGGTMEVVGYFDKTEPGLYLDQATLARLCSYSLGLDCDLYNCR